MDAHSFEIGEKNDGDVILRIICANGVEFKDEALDIFPIASQLLFEEGIQACVHYLEAVPWTRQQSVKINSLQSNLQLSEIFQGNACPAVEEVCRDAIINEFSLKIDRVKNVPVASRHY
ncbi:hypothetical protein SUGI_0415490 [Cryptomeria japonica]|nr:hypothetical protein SUGI_0415490 [Cryptomeria japonica]